MQAMLGEHVAAVDALANEGRDLLLKIDTIVLALTKPSGEEASIVRLFGQPQGRLETAATAIDERTPALRRPAFD